MAKSRFVSYRMNSSYVGVILQDFKYWQYPACIGWWVLDCVFTGQQKKRKCLPKIVESEREWELLFFIFVFSFKMALPGSGLQIFGLEYGIYQVLVWCLRVAYFSRASVMLFCFRMCKAFKNNSIASATIWFFAINCGLLKIAFKDAD